jgi:hypothetical protein
MAQCAYCGTGIIFGGKRQGNLRYCNALCAARANLLAFSHQVPDSVINEQLQKVHQGHCPKCGGPGPVEVHTSYRVWSAVILTNWNSYQQISCRSCALKRQLGSTAFCFFLGWWGFPWGLVMTPVQIVRNLSAAMSTPDTLRPSDKLERMIRINIASQIAANRAASPPVQAAPALQRRPD